MLSLKDIQQMTFVNWSDRRAELGQEIVTVKTVERKGAGAGGAR